MSTIDLKMCIYIYIYPHGRLLIEIAKSDPPLKSL